MTNEQLAILLDGLQAELDTAITEARILLTSGRAKVKDKQHDPACGVFFCQNPAHLVDTLVDDPVSELTPLDNFSLLLAERIKHLT